MLALRWAEAVERRDRVSETVDGGVVERRLMRDSMAAMGEVRRGSLESRSWYVRRILK